MGHKKALGGVFGSTRNGSVNPWDSGLSHGKEQRYGTLLLKTIGGGVCCPVGHGSDNRNCPSNCKDHVSHCRVGPGLDGQAS